MNNYKIVVYLIAAFILLFTQGCEQKTIKTGGPFYYEFFDIKKETPKNELAKEDALKKSQHYVVFFDQLGEIAKMTQYTDMVVVRESEYTHDKLGKLTSRKTTQFLPQGTFFVEMEFKDRKTVSTKKYAVDKNGKSIDWDSHQDNK